MKSYGDQARSRTSGSSQRWLRLERCVLVSYVKAAGNADLTSLQAERRAVDAHSDFDAVSRLVKLEFARYEHDRVEEFKHMFATYLDEMIVAQKEVSDWRSSQ